MEETRQSLLVAISLRLERAEHEVAHAAIDLLEVMAARAAPADLREAFRVRAMGAAWKREKLRELAADVRVGDGDVHGRMVYFLALDGVDPEELPSFREWLDERRPPATMT